MASAPSLAHAFEENAARYGQRVFLKEKRAGAWTDLSWAEIAAASRRLRTGLLELALRPADRVAILADNCPQWVITDLALLGMGAVVVPLYPTSSAEEIEHVLRDSETRAIAIRGIDNIHKVAAIGARLPGLEAIIAIDSGTAAQPVDAGGSRGRLVSMESLSAGRETAPIETSPAEVATIIYTSGTTGASKGVMLTHGNILANAESSRSALDLNDQDTILSFLPIAHSFERTAGYYTPMIGGGTIAYAEGLGQIAQNLLEVNPTVVLTVPRLLEVVHSRVIRTVERASPIRRQLFASAVAVGKRSAAYRFDGRRIPPHLAALMGIFRKVVFARIRGLFGTHLRYLISGGAPLPKEIFEFFSAAEIPICEGYGLTEASPVVSVNLLEGRTRPGSVGRPLAGVDVKLAEDGELLVRGPSVMKGYYKQEAETRQTVDESGWLHTGDIGAIDSEGYISIRDRKKEIIVLSGGKNVSPAALEAKLSLDQLIAQACVLGDRRKHVAALIVPDFEKLGEAAKQEGFAAGEPQKMVNDPKVRTLYHQHLRQINQTLADYEAIRSFRLIAEPFSQDRGEMTPTLKLRRKAILEHYRCEVESMYEAG